MNRDLDFLLSLKNLNWITNFDIISVQFCYHISAWLILDSERNSILPVLYDFFSQLPRNTCSRQVMILQPWFARSDRKQNRNHRGWLFVVLKTLSKEVIGFCWVHTVLSKPCLCSAPPSHSHNVFSFCIKHLLEVICPYSQWITKFKWKAKQNTDSCSKLKVWFYGSNNKMDKM